MKSKKVLPEPGVVVVLTFKGLAKGALGVHNGTTWFVWRLTNAGMTGEPNNWHPCEDHLIRDWAEIPCGIMESAGVYYSVQAPETRPIMVKHTAKPWMPIYHAKYPLGKKKKS